MTDVKELELITLYRGKDMATYIYDDFVKFGENAEPIRIRQNPSVNTPFIKIRLEDTDAIRIYKESDD